MRAANRMRVLASLLAVLLLAIVPAAGAATTGPSMKIKIDNANPMPWQALSGYVHVVGADGQPARNVTITLTQFAEYVPGQSSTLTGVTDANGNWFWNFALDASARLPGQHHVVALDAADGLSVVAYYYVA